VIEPAAVPATGPAAAPGEARPGALPRLLDRFEPAFVRLGTGAALVAAYAAVVAGAPLPPIVRLGIAVGALSFWPGAMLLRFFLVEREIEAPGRIAKSFALGVGLASAVAWLAHGLGFDPGVGLWLLPLLGLALACVRPARPGEKAEPRGLLPWTLLAAWVIVVTALVGSLGAPLMTDTDSLDHIGTVRRIADTRVVFPEDAFFADAGAHGADPRKGLYHSWVALFVRAAHVDPVDAWRWLPVFLVPVFLLAVAAFTLAVSGSRMSALVAGVLFPLLYGGGLGGTALRETVYSTRVGEIVALLAAASLVRLVEGGGRRRLLLWIALGFTAIAIHLWYALYFALAFGTYALGTVLVRRDGTTLRRFAAAFAGLAVVALPYLLFRAGQAYGPQNAIHTEPQGLFVLGERLFTVDPMALWAWNGLGLLVALAAAPWLWSRRRTSTGAIYLALVPWAVVGLVLNPLLLPLAHDRLGYLTMRLVWIVPVIPILAVVVTALGKQFVRGSGRGRALAAGGLAAFALWLLPQVGQAVSLVTERPFLVGRERERGADAWRDVLDWLRTAYPGPRVLLSDPATSYTIPAYTGHHVTTLLDQHSSPNDPRALERILAARDVLSPYVDERRTLELLRAWKVDAVLLNQRFEHVMTFDYWSVSPSLYGPTRAKFERHPQWFRPIYDASGATVYELTPEAKQGPLPAPRAIARPVIPLAGDAAAGEIDGPFTLHRRAVTDRSRYAPGDTVRVTTWWSTHAAKPLPPGSYTVFVRLDGPAPRGPLYHDLWQKPYRKLAERVTGRRWRVRESHRVTHGIFGPDLWRPSEVVADSTLVVLPPDVAPGPWVVRIRMLRLPHYPNSTPRDYLSDDDSFNGTAVDTVLVVAAR
jgi:hypothetical protein